MIRSCSQHGNQQTLYLLQLSKLLKFASQLENVLDPSVHSNAGLLRNRLGLGSPRNKSALLGDLRLRRIDPKYVQQRHQARAVEAPAADRIGINRRADLSDTCRFDRPPRPVERKTALIPIEAAILDETTGLPLEILDEILVLQLQHGALR